MNGSGWVWVEIFGTGQVRVQVTLSATSTSDPNTPSGQPSDQGQRKNKTEHTL